MRLIAPIAVFVSSLVLVAPAMASDNGEGLLGETDDKLVTYFCLGVIIFFALAVILLSALQGALDRRKEQRKAVEFRRRVGW
ncbi:MAG TPA: hypothetical protein VGF25_06525 [Thermoleophilaceae bacterium]|jgi:hypothetical protein